MRIASAFEIQWGSRFMPHSPRPIDPKEASLIASVVGAVLLLTPGRYLWAFPGAPWWTPLCLWGALIGLGAWVATRRPAP